MDGGVDVRRVSVDHDIEECASVVRVAALVEHGREVREMFHQLGGRKLHIARHNWSLALNHAYCGRYVKRERAVVADVYSNYEYDDREGIFCHKCVDSLVTSDYYA